ncbi:hypothetical protein FDP41_006412 [Naegleria fowleri]|uniref:Uncharacterized protein n=1 Tax=Naegleria fowleri TaxID=5763 RepID=A0A6A5BK13_NAEFO|nr:uncharacterized protein FDP41_006412 [Naegleria fowleri]KAF0974380.1 hypothetical protein FDP41_006412 [Naegleria fowleri]
MSWLRRKKDTSSDPSSLDSMYELHTLNTTICFIPFTFYQQAVGGDEAQKLFRTGYYYSCLDNLFKKYDLYSDKAKKVLWQEKDCFPNYEPIHEIMIRTALPSAQKKKVEETPEEKESLAKFIHTTAECIQKRITKTQLEEKLKKAMTGKFSESAPIEWYTAFDKNSSQDYALNTQMKQQILEDTMNPCLKFKPSSLADLHPRSVHGKKEIPKEEFNNMINTMKFEHCNTSLLCSKSITNCLKRMNKGDDKTAQNQHFIQCFNDPEVRACISKI